MFKMSKAILSCPLLLFGFTKSSSCPAAWPPPGPPSQEYPDSCGGLGLGIAGDSLGLCFLGLHEYLTPGLTEVT